MGTKIQKVKKQENKNTDTHKSQTDYLFKIILIGDSCVGKEELLRRYSNNPNYQSQVSTTGTDFVVRTLVIGDTTVKLQIWDTAGQERFPSSLHLLYHGALGILFVYDITIKKSFTTIQNWIKQDKHYIQNIHQILVGNRCDLVNDRKVTTQEAQDIADQLGMDFFETSVHATNIEEELLKIASPILEKFKPRDQIAMLWPKSHHTLDSKIQNAVVEMLCVTNFVFNLPKDVQISIIRIIIKLHVN
jgi:small GTP-binding protein